ncbi:competence protein TfoX [Campylobacter sp. CCS1377]|uniref:Competence protein TfoX n=1 Tax=Campylobacter sp. CCS1377 TaxID=3158229 RepID=A0AAU7E7D0_9BACT|nr:competence protein TfoX [Campylobacter jejuni]
MASSEDFKDFVLEQLRLCESKSVFSARKMFGEYCVYIDTKPAFLICDDVLYIKQFPFLKELLKDNDLGTPFPKAKQWYILDIEDIEILKKVIEKFASKM